MNENKAVAGLPESRGACKSLGAATKLDWQVKKQTKAPRKSGCNSRDLTTRTKPKRWQNPAGC